MSAEPRYDRPNTVSGLAAKHAELVKLRDADRAEIKKLTVDIDHLDAAIRLFDPQADYQRHKLRAHVVRHRAQKGQVKRFVLDALREADRPMTSREIAAAWCAERGLAADAETTNTIRKRITACIKTCEQQGVVAFAGMTTDHGEFGPHKLWTVARGGV